MKVVLSIAGSDSGGGAGIQADLKTFEAFGVFGTTVITALTAQNTQGVQAVFPVPPQMVQAQLNSILEDFQVAAIKIGMLYDKARIDVVVKELEKHKIPIVLDPVMVSTSGSPLLDTVAIEHMQKAIFPLAAIITPNWAEAGLLAKVKVTSEERAAEAAKKLSEQTPESYVLVKGGHGNEEKAIDWLCKGGKLTGIKSERIFSKHTHGSGCTLSAAIAALIASGKPVPDAVKEAKKYIVEAIRHSPGSLGKGDYGSLRHGWKTKKDANI